MTASVQTPRHSLLDTIQFLEGQNHALLEGIGRESISDTKNAATLAIEIIRQVKYKAEYSSYKSDLQDIETKFAFFTKNIFIFDEGQAHVESILKKIESLKSRISAQSPKRPRPPVRAESGLDLEASRKSEVASTSAVEVSPPFRALLIPLIMEPEKIKEMIQNGSKQSATEKCKAISQSLELLQLALQKIMKNKESELIKEELDQIKRGLEAIYCSPERMAEVAKECDALFRKVEVVNHKIFGPPKKAEKTPKNAEKMSGIQIPTGAGDEEILRTVQSLIKQGEASAVDLAIELIPQIKRRDLRDIGRTEVIALLKKEHRYKEALSYVKHIEDVSTFEEMEKQLKILLVIMETREEIKPIKKNPLQKKSPEELLSVVLNAIKTGDYDLEKGEVKIPAQPKLLEPKKLTNFEIERMQHAIWNLLQEDRYPQALVKLQEMPAGLAKQAALAEVVDYLLSKKNYNTARTLIRDIECEVLRKAFSEMLIADSNA